MNCNIKLSSSSQNKGTETFADSFVVSDFDKDKVLAFDTGDSNIRVYVNDIGFSIRFVKREYFRSTTEAIHRLTQVQTIERRFNEYIAEP